MNTLAEIAYRFTPARLRSVPASLQGYYLRSWRYGPETERLVEETLARDYWTTEQWQSWRTDTLNRLLERAARCVPYYRHYWHNRATQLDPPNLDQWPVLEKEPLRSNPSAFLAEGVPSRLYAENTSGTTGTPLTLRQSRTTLRTWYAMFEARTRRWYGVSRYDRWAILGGRMVQPVRRNRPPYWVWNTAFRQLYLSSYHISSETISSYLDAMKRYGVTYLLGYPSALFELALGTIDLKRRDLRMKVAVTNAEPLFEYQRSIIAKAFNCPVRETYGMSELAAAASECEAGQMHLWPDAGIVEVLENDRPVGPGAVGDLVVTGLLNSDMPLIRYRVGDRGALSEKTSCACGRTLPVLQSVDGRSDDALYTPDGRTIGRLDPAFKVGLPIREAQVIQEEIDLIRVRYVPAPAFAARHGEEIIRQVRSRLGNVRVILEAVTQVPRTANGKFRAVICNLPPGSRFPGSRPDSDSTPAVLAEP